MTDEFHLTTYEIQSMTKHIDLPGNANERTLGESRHQSIYFGGYDPAFNQGPSH